MDFKWVLADYKKTQDLKLQKSKTDQVEIHPIIDKPNDAKLSGEDATRIEHISKFYKSACEQIPYMFPSREKNEVVSPTKSKILLIGFISTSIRRYVWNQIFLIWKISTYVKIVLLDSYILRR